MSRSSTKTSTVWSERSGYIHLCDGGRTWSKVFASLAKHTLSISTDHKSGSVVATHDMLDATVRPVEGAGSSRPYAFEVQVDGTAHLFAGSSTEDRELWLTRLHTSTVAGEWPGGLAFNGQPAPLRYSTLSISVPAAAGAAAAAAPVNPLAATHATLKSVPVWQQPALLLTKLRQCSVLFDGPEGAGPPAGQAVGGAGGPDDRDVKRQVLLELVDFCDASPQVFTDFRVLEEVFVMLRMNLFRSLPKPDDLAGEADDEEEQFMDQQWPHLSVVYEFLLHVVTQDRLDLGAKKKVIDSSFVRQLLLLFDSEDMRERDYLKTITHRIYSKLTQRRALIRRVICNIFFEFVYETGRHNGIAEMLEILASIINGFAVPIKKEHKVMLVRALLPLHKPKNVMAYHPQLSYCMALYVAKDHLLTQSIIPGLLRFWPTSNSAKQIMFLNELDDVFEYVQEGDLETFRTQLCLRLAKCIGGLHFQVAERALCLWNSERFAALLLEDGTHRAAALPVLFPALFRNSESHWHESVRALSTQVLEQYMDVDPDLYQSCLDKAPAASK